jgi:hypothetical protein
MSCYVDGVNMKGDYMNVQFTRQDLFKIYESAHKEFLNTLSFGSLSPSEIQVYLITKGLEGILKSKGIDIDFEITLPKK